MAKIHVVNTAPVDGASSLSVTPLDALIAHIDQVTGTTDLSGETDTLNIAQDSPKHPSVRLIRYHYIRFYLGDILLAIPLSSALEIGHRPAITLLPNLPEWVLGVSNIRGEIISIVDLKIFFGLIPQKVNRDRRFIVVRNKEIKVGLIVDRIIGIYSPNQLQAEIQESPYEEGELSTYISGIMIVDDQLLNILAVDKLLTSPRMNAFRAE